MAGGGMKKEIVRQALRHGRPAVVPHYIGLTQEARRKLQGHFGESLALQLNNFLSVHYLDRPDAWQWTSADTIRDMWGILWDRSVDRDIGVPREPRFSEPHMRYWDPPAVDESLLAPVRAFVRENRGTFTVVSLSYFTLYDARGRCGGSRTCSPTWCCTPASSRSCSTP
jgi:uroporphyrinogen decarboxylase